MKEVLAGAVLDLHVDEALKGLGAAQEKFLADALRVKDERDAAVTLLRRTLELEWIGGQGQHKTEIRAFFSRIGVPQVITRHQRGLDLERAISAYNPETDEALELFQTITKSLKDRYGEDRCVDLQKRMAEVEEALGEIETADYEARR